MLDTLLPIIATLLGGASVASLVMQILKTKVMPAIDQLSGLQQQVIVLGLAFFIPRTAALLGIPLPAALSGWAEGALSAGAMAIMAYGLHAVKKAAGLPSMPPEEPAPEQ